MKFYQEAAIDLSRGTNFLPQRMRYRLPDKKTDTSIFLLSNSYEYDIELIKNMPQPKTDYKNIIIPYRVTTKIGIKPLRYLLTQNEYNRKVKYLNEKKLMPPVLPVRFPYPSSIKENIYISMSDIIPLITPYIRRYPRQFIQENIFDLFKKVISLFNFSRNKVMIIDTTHYKIYKKPTMDTFMNDLINSLITAYIYNPIDEIKKIDMIVIFRSEEADYKFDLSLFEKRDIVRMKTMLEKIGVESETSITSDTETEEDGSSESFENDEEDEVDVDDALDNNDDIDEEKPEVDKEVKYMNQMSSDATSSIKDTLNQLHTKFASKNANQENEETLEDSNSKLNKAKIMNINVQLMQRINPMSNIVSGYKKLSEQEGIKSKSVEDQMMDKAIDDASKMGEQPNEQTAINAVSSERERLIRQQVGQVKLNNVTFDKLTSIVDVPKPKPRKVSHLTTTCPAALKGSSFAYITKEYEDKLMDRDIVDTFMNFSKLPGGFYVTNVDVTDVSDPTNLMNNWKITLKNKVTDKQSVINVRIPKVNNGRFYSNGIWYVIGKQDFPIPILKLNAKTVMLTSNYNKITCTRYNTKSLIDIGMMMKAIDASIDKNGSNKYVKVGNSTVTNSRFISTIEYDEYAKKWVSFINKEANLEINFNRVNCEKLYGFVNVNQNEFCCGMLNKVPIVLNTETGMTRSNETLTNVIYNTLPEDIRQEYRKVKPGKTSMYAEMKMGATIPIGVAISAWEGLSSLIKKSKADHKIFTGRSDDPNYFVIPFKDKNLGIKFTTLNQLLFNGFYRINTKAYNMSDFEVPIMNSNSVFVDIFNQLFFKQYSQLSIFTTNYYFFVDAITANVCDHYHIPNDIAGMLIYAANMLADNNCKSEHNAALYRIRSSEIIPAILHYRLALAISKYNNNIGSKTRDNNFVFNPNEVMIELLATQNVNPTSALNPMIELHGQENVTKTGFKGVNSTRAYTLEKRSYEDSMVGKLAISSPNSANVGISRQLTADPKIESVRGYTSDVGVEGDFNDFQLASFSELTTTGTVTRDDAIRTAIATSQTGHIISTAAAQPTLISNGMDEVVPAYLSEEFSYVAPEDGKVLEINDDYMILQFKSGKKKAIDITHKQSFNSGSGFYVDNKLIPNAKANDNFKEGDVLAYHHKFFTKDIDGTVRLNIGPLAKVAFLGTYGTYEDAGVITHKMSKKLGTSLTMMQSVKIDATDDIESVVKPGTEVLIGDPLIVFGLGDTGDKSVDNFLKAFQSSDTNSALDNAKRIIRAKHSGKVADVRMYTTKSLERLSPSLFKIFDKYFKDNLQKRKILDKYDKTNSVYKMDTVFTLPTEPLKGSTIKGQTCDILIEIYIEHEDELSIGDKAAMYGASKQVCSEVIPLGLEPYSETRPDEEVSMFVCPSCILKRMIPSLIITSSGNKVLVELKRSIARIWNEK